MWIAFFVIIGVIVIGAGVAMLALEPGRREAMNVNIGEIDFNNLQDGVYTGEYKGTKDHLRDVKVQITISSGKLTEIKVVGGAMSNEKQTAEIKNGLTINDVFDQVIQSESMHRVLR